MSFDEIATELREAEKRADEAAAAERAKVVAWLRAQEFPVNTRLCNELADAIEALAHHEGDT